MASAGERTALLKYQCLTANKWSRYPATQDVNMDCNSIKNILSETFCDGTYIGPGSSFDISSGQAIDITSSSTLTMSSTGTGAPRVILDSLAAEVRGNDIPVRLRRYSATGTTLVSDIQLTGDGVVSIIGSTVAVEPTSGYLQITGNSGSAPPRVRLFDGLNGGSVKYDSTVGMEINTESAATGDFGIAMTPANGIVELKGDTSIPYPATLTFTDTSMTVPTVNMSVSNDGFGFGYPQLNATAGLLSTSSGAVEGVAIGTNGTENVVIGYGLPLKIANKSNFLPTDYISVEDTGSGGRAKIVQTEEVNIETPLLKIVGIPSATKSNILYYDSATNAVSYGSPFPAVTVQAATGTIALTEAMNRSTYILTGTSATQTFSVAGLAGVAAGWTVYLRNGNNATGLTQDITISIPAGITTLHAPTGTTNSSFILLYWNGSALVAYR
jgi:hypothetical protein